MAKLTPAQIKGYAAGAGFSGADLNIAVAVALAESGGNTNAHNPVGRDNSYGLWQINMLGAMGPDRRKRFKLSKNEDLYDPATNARVAYGIFKDQGWQRGWTTYSRGTYKKYMDEASAANGVSVSESDTGNDETATATTGAGTDGSIVTGGLNALGSNIFNAVQNIGGVIIGVVLIVAAVIILMVQSKTGKSAVKKGFNAVTSLPGPGKAAKTVAVANAAKSAKASAVAP